MKASDLNAFDSVKEALPRKGDLDLTCLFRIMSALGIRVTFHTAD
jgi:DNA-binding phage protein